MTRIARMFCICAELVLGVPGVMAWGLCAPHSYTYAYTRILHWERADRMRLRFTTAAQEGSAYKEARNGTHHQKRKPSRKPLDSPPT